MSAGDFGKGAGLLAVTDFADSADFGGEGLAGEFGSVLAFAGDPCGGGLASARFSIESAVSTATDGVFVTPLLLAAA